MNAMIELSGAELQELQLFRLQFLQLLELPKITWPGGTVLRNPQAQQWLYYGLFDQSRNPYLPPKRYQARVLKQLLQRIEEGYVDPEEDEISDDLSAALADLMATGLPVEATEVQQKSYVTYNFTGINRHERTDIGVTILESRSIISSEGTTGLRTWEAALHLGNYLSTVGRSYVQDQHVLELGAGTGLLSILAAKHLGARHVAATDGDEGVVDALRTNLYLNDLEGDPRIESLVLRWGLPLTDTVFADSSKINTVIGADLTYDATVISRLVYTIRDMLWDNPALNVLIAATIRNEHTFARFLAACEQRKLPVTDVTMSQTAGSGDGGPFYSTEVPIRIVRISMGQERVDEFAF